MQPFHKNISIRASEDNEFILRNQENDYQSTPLLGTKSDDNFAKQSLEFSASQRLARKTDIVGMSEFQPRKNFVFSGARPFRPMYIGFYLIKKISKNIEW